MAEQEVVIKFVIGGDLPEAFKAQASAVQSAAAKLQADINGVGKAAAGPTAQDFQTFGNTSRSEIASVGKAFSRFSGEMQMFGSSVLRGDLVGAVVSFTRMAVTAIKSISIEVALATGGISLAIGAIALFISRTRSEHAELQKLQGDKKTEQEALTKFLIDTSATQYEKDTRTAKAAAKERNDGLMEQYKIDEKRINEKHDKGRMNEEEYLLAIQVLDIKYKGLSTRSHVMYQAEITKIEEQAEGERNKKKLEKPTGNKGEPKSAISGMSLKDMADFENKFNKNIEKIGQDRNKKAVELQQERQDAETETFKNAAAERVAIFDAEEQRKIKIAAEQQKLKEDSISGAGSIMGSLGNINSALKGNAELSRGLAIGETIMNTAVAIMKVTAQAGILSPFVIPAIIAQGAAQLAVISAQKFARGGDFETRGPQMIMVGDNPGGREHVSVTPISSQNYNGPNAGGIVMGDIVIHGNADAGTVKALNQSRVKQLKELRQMIMELGYSRQLPSFA